MKKLIPLVLAITLIASCSKDEPITPAPQPVDAAFSNPNIGGANEQNQVYIDLSTGTETTVQRDSWDLRFYNGSSFQVGINYSVYMACTALETTNLNEVSSTTVADLQTSVAVGTFDASNTAYVDDFDGDVSNTAIATISANDDDNKVYLINLGYYVGTETPAAGSVAATGDARGWKKIRILKRNNAYLLQYADLDDTSFQEVTIAKNNDYNFTFFSLSQNQTVTVSPTKQDWDICFTVFTNEIPSYGTYGYIDFVLSNNLQAVQAYQVNTTDFDFEAFTANNILQANFVATQRAIGSGWRVGGGPGTTPHVKDDVFYILKDIQGNYYKLKFLTLTDTNGVRGNTQFQYKLL